MLSSVASDAGPSPRFAWLMIAPTCSDPAEPINAPTWAMIAFCTCVGSITRPTSMMSSVSSAGREKKV